MDWSSEVRSDRIRTAWHEAAHAVVALAIGWSVRRVTIIPRRDLEGPISGETNVRPPDGASLHEVRIGTAAVALAGDFGAELSLRFGGTRSTLDPAKTADLEAAMRAVAECPGDSGDAFDGAARLAGHALAINFDLLSDLAATLADRTELSTNAERRAATADAARPDLLWPDELAPFAARVQRVGIDDAERFARERRDTERDAAAERAAKARAVKRIEALGEECARLFAREIARGAQAAIRELHCDNLVLRYFRENALGFDANVALYRRHLASGGGAR